MAQTPEKELARRTRRGFVGLGAGAAAFMGGFLWLGSGYEEGDIPPRMRSILQFNEKAARNVLYNQNRLVRTFPASAIGTLKKNGDIGLDEEADPREWRLDSPSGQLTIQEIQSLPKHEETIEFKCVEGWSTITSFAGARLSDFTARFAAGKEKMPYVGMNTPDEEYYVSIDMPSAMHPQTLLAYEMNGAPLTQEHGAPLRLVVPVKYGIKNIKNIGKIEYTDHATPDYWAERGYDWYAGL